MRSAIFAAVLVVLSGCIYIGPRGHDPCQGWSSENYVVTAHDAGLFAAVQTATPANWTRKDSASEVRNETLDQLLGNYRLIWVIGPETGLPEPDGWPDGYAVPAGHVTLGLSRSGVAGVHLPLDDGVPDREIVPWAERFLENITTLDRQGRHDWAVRFAANNELKFEVQGGRRLYERTLTLEAPLDLGSLWARVNPRPEVRGDLPGIDDRPTVHARANDWDFLFLTEPIALARDGERLELARDDSVAFRGDWTCRMVFAKDPRGGTRLNATLPLADFNEAYSSLGRPTPTDAQLKYVGPIY